MAEIDDVPTPGWRVATWDEITKGVRVVWVRMVPGPHRGSEIGRGVVLSKGRGTTASMTIQYDGERHPTLLTEARFYVERGWLRIQDTANA